MMACGVIAAIAVLVVVLSIGSGPTGATMSAPAAEAFAPPAPLPEPPPRDLEWTKVKGWKGSGTKTTERFTVSGPEWRIAWAGAREVFPGAGILQIFVYRSDGELVELAANKVGPGADVSYVQSGPGEYYLMVNSANLDWEITVSDSR